MRVKTITAATVSEALAIVRKELGEDAIIISTTHEGDTESDGARVMAAIEDAPETPEKSHDSGDHQAGDPDRDLPETLRQLLISHGTPTPLTNRLVAAAITFEPKCITTALAMALDQLFPFVPLSIEKSAKPIMVIGPPGVGKTVTAAKIAAKATLSDFSVGMVTMDTQRAGAIEQLEAFTRLLKVELKCPADKTALTRDVSLLGTNDLVIIDTPGLNPFSPNEREALRQSILAVGAEPILVLNGGGDALEAADIAASLTDLGIERFIATRLDITRRLGSILAAADAGRLSFTDVSITPTVGGGLTSINAASLARLITRTEDDLFFETPVREAQL